MTSSTAIGLSVRFICYGYFGC